MSVVPSALLGPDFVEAVAERVVELLEAREHSDAAGKASAHRLTVAEVAARYRVSRRWVYAHQCELGAMRLGAGPRARLRFDSDVVAAAIAGFETTGSGGRSIDRQRPAGRRMPLIPFEPMG